MHECPECGMACDCDGDDTWFDTAPDNCECACVDEMESGWADEDWASEGDVWEPCELCGFYFDTGGADIDLCSRCQRIENAAKNIVRAYAPQLAPPSLWPIMQIIFRDVRLAAAEQSLAGDAGATSESDKSESENAPRA